MVADAPSPPPSDDACAPCRGTGSVLSGQGGRPHAVTCPWCGGTGRDQRGRDAQAHWRREGGMEPGGPAGGAVTPPA